MKERLARIPGFATVFRVLDRYRLDAADQFAAAIGLFAFLALVPLLLLTVALVGYLLRDPATQVELVTSLTEAVPGFAATLGEGGVEGFVDGIVERRGAITGVGLVTLLFTGLRPVTAGQVAMSTVFRTPLPQGPMSKVRGVLTLVVLGVVALAGVASSTLVGFAELPGYVRFAVSTGLTYVLDVVLFYAAFVMLSPGGRVRGRFLAQGAALAAVGWTALKLLGSAYVGNQVSDANALYGAIGGVVAAVLLFYLAGRLFLYGAELAAVRYEAAHGPMPLPPGTATLARIDDPLPDGERVGAHGHGNGNGSRAPSVTVPLSTDPAAPAAAEGTAVATGGVVAGGPTGRRRDTGQVDVRRLVGLGIGLAAAAAASRLWRGER
ncbi:YihY family inner membrane protein [Nitriliruptoraceae bacterium ZYF776]|nr:YihY family inner membrane protein [Profundirhabdus halotolerans]